VFWVLTAGIYSHHTIIVRGDIAGEKPAPAPAPETPSNP
jgi:hypothetical protein